VAPAIGMDTAFSRLRAARAGRIDRRRVDDAETDARATEYQVKAAYLYKFIGYVE
jgi:hypothetical protein